MASTSYRLADKGRNVKTYTHWGMKTPLLAKLQIRYAGSSSFSFDYEVTEESSGEILFSAVMTFVYVDFRTRKPAKFPAWYNKWKNQQSLGTPPTRLETPLVPSNAFRFDVQASFSDIDHNGHINQSIYVKWSTDAGTEAALKGHYSHFNENIGKYPLKTLDLKYLGEGIVNDVIEIFSWQDAHSPLVLHFVFKNKGKIAVVARFEYESKGIGPKL